MALVHLHLGEQQADPFGRAGDGVDAVPRPRRMARRALHRHEHVDAAAVAERNLEPGPAQHRHVSARTPAPSTTLLMASCFPVSPERQQVKMSSPVIATLLAITVSMACSMAAKFAFCSLAPFPITHSPRSPYPPPSATSRAQGLALLC